VTDTGQDPKTLEKQKHTISRLLGGAPSQAGNCFFCFSNVFVFFCFSKIPQVFGSCVYSNPLEPMKFSVQCISSYPLVNQQFDPENHQVLMETSLPTPICQGRTVNLLEGKSLRCQILWWPSQNLPETHVDHFDSRQSSHNLGSFFQFTRTSGGSGSRRDVITCKCAEILPSGI